MLENADYYDDWSESTADSLIKDATKFIKIGRGILSQRKK
jgi:hypothetical protein